MIALLSAAAVITIAILVKTGIIKYYTRGGGVLVMALTALASGLFGYQVIRSSLALFCEQLGFGEGLLDVFKVESDSAAGSAVKLGLLLFLSLPLVIAEIFIIYSMIKEPIKRVAMHTDMEYEPPTRPRLEGLRETGLILRGDRKVGNLMEGTKLNTEKEGAGGGITLLGRVSGGVDAGWGGASVSG